METATALTVVDNQEVTTWQEMDARLRDMKQRLGLVQQFFREVMVQGQDYGVIPGTDKPTLLKAGAEKLCELYGYAPVVKNVEEEKNIETGFYRARVTVALVHRKTGVVIAEGVGEANTMEGRYRYRWVPEWKLPPGVDTTGLFCEERTAKDGRTYRMYRIENTDAWALWNTILKMAKKRALIDATLSATRSSGIFTQDVEDLEEWMAVAPEMSSRPSQAVNQTPKPRSYRKQNGSSEVNWQTFWSSAKNLGFDEEQVHAIASELFGQQVNSLTEVIHTQAEASKLLNVLAQRRKASVENEAATA